MDLQFERSYPTPLSSSALLPILLLSLSRQRHTPDASPCIHDEYDYIVVGGGAAGSVVAGRLSEDPCVSVLLLEAGHKPPMQTEVPAFGLYFLGTDVDWKFRTVPQKHAASGLTNRQVYFGAGKMLGGSSNHNGMAYVRGNKKDYDDWAAQGAEGWTYKDVFPYFLKLEDNRSPVFLANCYHAMGGPITVESATTYNPAIKKALYKAALSFGYRFVDSNAAQQTGFYCIQKNVRDSQRCSAAKGYLVPAENRTNLDIYLNTLVTKITTEDGRATGVKIFHDGRYRIVRARREVVISAGAVNTPKLLLLSGIGPKKELQKLGIPVISGLPSVGKNLHDHASSIYYSALNPCSQTLDELLSDPINIRQYIATRRGPLSEFHMIQSFLNGNQTADIDFPNYGLMLGQIPANFVKGLGPNPEVYEKFFSPYEGRAIFICLSSVMRPKSRGTVSLNSSDPFDPPLIDPNYLEHLGDLDSIVDGFKTCKKLMTSAPVLKLGVHPFETLVPGCEKYKESDDEYFKCYAEKLLITEYHPVGTCKMGNPGDPTTVVDPELRVKGIQGLRIVDASVMPTIPSGNIHIPTIMVAEKACDLIKKSSQYSKCFPGCSCECFHCNSRRRDCR